MQPEETIIPPKKPKKKYNYTEKTGRPTKYRPQYCQKVVDFFDIKHFKVINKKQVGNPLRFLSQFARKIGVSRDTLYEWAKTNKEFSYALTRAQELQQEMMVSNGVKGLYQPHFTIFSMKNMHGWRDKTEIDHGVTDELLEKYKDMGADDIIAKEEAAARAIIRISRAANSKEKTAIP